jgi:hypothetical protein
MPASATKIPPHDDFELVRRVCSGDRAAATILFSDVLGPLLARLSDRWQYPDLSQDLYMRLSANDWAALRSWAGRASLTAWAGSSSGGPDTTAKPRPSWQTVAAGGL